MAAQNYGMRADVLMQRAIELKENPLLDALLREFQENAVANWAATTPEEIHHRESAWYQYLVTLELRTRIDNILSDLRSTDPDNKGEADG